MLGQAQGKATNTGALASATVEQLLDNAQQGLRSGRALGLKASQAMLDGYSTLVSGVLIGMSDALQPGVQILRHRAREKAEQRRPRCKRWAHRGTRQRRGKG